MWTKLSGQVTYINKKSQPEILSTEDERFGEVVTYMDEITRNQNLDTKYIIEGKKLFFIRHYQDELKVTIRR